LEVHLPNCQRAILSPLNSFESVGAQYSSHSLVESKARNKKSHPEFFSGPKAERSIPAEQAVILRIGRWMSTA
jgi:hypothetical protein